MVKVVGVLCAHNLEENKCKIFGIDLDEDKWKINIVDNG
jgi:hypothetical protein